MSSSVFRSLALHALLVAIAFFALKPPFPSGRVSAPEPYSVVLGSRSARKASQPSPSHARKASPARKPIDLRSLGIFAKGIFPKPGTPGSSDASDSGPKSPYGFENQLTTKSSPILSYLYHRIDGGLAFPSELLEAGFSGEVTATLKFDDKGAWEDSPSQIRAEGADARYFRVYVIRRLRALLSDPIPENLWKADPHPLSIEARFAFAIVAPEGVEGAKVGPMNSASADPTKFAEVDNDGGQSIEQRLIPGKQGAFGRDFFFYRVHLVSPLAWKLGPLAGYGIMPTVGINPGWFVDTISDLIHHRAKIDPLLSYRDDPEW